MKYEQLVKQVQSNYKTQFGDTLNLEKIRFIIDSFINEIVNNMKNNIRTNITGFGTFTTSLKGGTKKKVPDRSNNTLMEVWIPKRYYAVFNPAKKLKDILFDVDVSNQVDS